MASASISSENIIHHNPITILPDSIQILTKGLTQNCLFDQWLKKSEKCEFLFICHHNIILKKIVLYFRDKAGLNFSVELHTQKKVVERT